MSVRATVYIATSLDGFIARLDGSLDWLPHGADSDGEDYGYSAVMNSVDALVMGRLTYEKVRTFDAWPYKKPVFVLSSKRIEIPRELSKMVTRMGGKPDVILSHLEEQGIKADVALRQELEVHVGGREPRLDVHRARRRRAPLGLRRVRERRAVVVRRTGLDAAAHAAVVEIPAGHPGPVAHDLVLLADLRRDAHRVVLVQPVVDRRKVGVYAFGGGLVVNGADRRLRVAMGGLKLGDYGLERDLDRETEREIHFAFSLLVRSSSVRRKSETGKMNEELSRRCGRTRNAPA